MASNVSSQRQLARIAGDRIVVGQKAAQVGIDTRPARLIQFPVADQSTVMEGIIATVAGVVERCSLGGSQQALPDAHAVHPPIVILRE